MKIWKKVTLAIIAITICTVLMVGCNTFKGLGKDIEGAGQTIQKGADKTKEAIKK